ncbi:ABC transporter substrate-binding protein [Gammaproteobacteria bacterium]|nr:ABC transporter substrate-binding protein [Gammaproteobacteria bacterium]
MDFIRRGLITTLLTVGTVLIAGTGQVHADEFSDGAEKFITSLAAKAEVSLLSDEITPIEHQKRFRELMLDSFDLNGVGKWVIGRYWRRTSKSERVRYLSLFEKFIIATYSKRFRGYTKAKLQINGSTKSNNSALVESQINRNNSKPIKIIWRVKLSNGKYKIIDIIIEGVSWVQTQRSEFVSVIRNSGGKVSGLIKALNKKIIYLTSSKN